MKFCSQCGEPVILTIPEGDHRERHVCGSCATIHYRNPNIIAGTIPRWGDRILLCKRAIEPRRDLWTVPAGFLEMGETIEQGAIRETLEETGAEVSIEALHGVYSILHAEQVYMLYRAQLKTPAFGPTPESSEVRLFSEEEIPWQDLAFKVIETALRHYFSHRRSPRAHPFTRYP